MAVRSRRVFGPLLLANPPALVYTVPAGRTLVLRSILFANAGALAVNVNLRIGAAAGNTIVFFGSVPAGGTIAVPDDVIANPGDTIYAGQAVGGAVGVSAFGSLLEGAPA